MDYLISLLLHEEKTTPAPGSSLLAAFFQVLFPVVAEVDYPEIGLLHLSRPLDLHAPTLHHLKDPTKIERLCNQLCLSQFFLAEDLVHTEAVNQVCQFFAFALQSWLNGLTAAGAATYKTELFLHTISPQEPDFAILTFYRVAKTESPRIIRPEPPSLDNLARFQAWTGHPSHKLAVTLTDYLIQAMTTPGTAFCGLDLLAALCSFLSLPGHEALLPKVLAEVDGEINQAALAYLSHFIRKQKRSVE